jgi:hypothetical protein
MAKTERRSEKWKDWSETEVIKRVLPRKLVDFREAADSDIWPEN